MGRFLLFVVVALACGAGPPPEHPTPAPAPARRNAATNEAIADQFTMLAFDADPVVGGEPRTRLARWIGPVDLFVSGAEIDVRRAAETAGVLSRLTGLPIDLVRGGSPNLVLAVTSDPGGLFAGPLRRLLLAAFESNDAAVDAFVGQVASVEPCWALAIWGDPAQTVIKAAVVGIDARQPRAGIERCMAQKLAAAVGLLGPAGYLPRSVFSPQSASTYYSLEDGLMLRLLYSPALKPGMSRDEAHQAALAALSPPRRR